MEVVLLVICRDHVMTRVILLFLLLLVVIVVFASFCVACVRVSSDLLQGLVATGANACISFLEGG